MRKSNTKHHELMTNDLVHGLFFLPHSFQFVIDDFMTLLSLFMYIPPFTIVPGNERNESQCRSGKLKAVRLVGVATAPPFPSLVSA